MPETASKPIFFFLMNPHSVSRVYPQKIPSFIFHKLLNPESSVTYGNDHPAGIGGVGVGCGIKPECKRPKMGPATNPPPQTGKSMLELRSSTKQ